MILKERFTAKVMVQYYLQNTTRIPLLAVDWIIPNSITLTRIRFMQPEDEDGISSCSSILNDRMNSRLVYHDTLLLNDKTYLGVFEFELRDLYIETNDFTVVSFTYGQESGLLKYSLRNGQYFERVGE